MYSIPLNRRKEIENCANEIIEKYNIDESDFDLTQFLAKNENIRIKTKVLDSNITGLLYVDDIKFIKNTNTHRLIVINELLRLESNYSKKRRFVIAHEYGHFILHKKSSTQFERRDYRKLDTPEELEADYFAKCLLMPEKKFKKVLQSLDVITNIKNKKISYLSDIFWVTSKKAKQRIEDFEHTIE